MSPRFSADSIVGSTLVGQRRLRLVRLLASGGLAHVYLAQDDDGSTLTVKLLRPEHQGKREVLARFEREALAASRIRHDNVLAVHETVKHAGPFSFFSAEHLDGVDLADLIGTRGSLQPARALRVCAGVAAGLGAAHAAGVVHRDVKPENIFLVHSADGREIPKVVDFGSASLSEDPGPSPNARITMTTGFVGTPGYVAPEQAEGMPGAPPADVYSLGVVLFELVAGRPPFAGGSWAELLIQHARAELLLPEWLSPQLSAVLRSMLVKRQEDRIATMEEVVRALRSLPEWAG
ncbi:MAG: serine/threonine protein kinase [Polyangiaceae bacterium]|nr:serine/threonine protein kinase [Polyangiaceae bacterium]